MPMRNSTQQRGSQYTCAFAHVDKSASGSRRRRGKRDCSARARTWATTSPKDVDPRGKEIDARSVVPVAVYALTKSVWVRRFSFTAVYDPAGAHSNGIRQIGR